MGFSEQAVLVGTGRDPCVYEYLGAVRNSTDESASVITSGGAKMVTPEEYMRVANCIRADVVVPMGDEVVADSKPSRIKTACRRTSEWVSRSLQIGCGNAVKNAKLLKEKNPHAQVFVLYRDVRTFGKNEEEYYEDVQRKGVKFLRFTEDREPQVTVKDGKITVTIFDLFLQENIELPADLVVLHTALEGDDTAENLKKLLKVPLGDGHYCLEAHAKIRPLDFPTDGVYLCGAAHSPKGIADSIAQAVGAASRAAVPMMKGWVTVEPTTSKINPDLCSGCGICIQICPYSAIERGEDGKSRVIEALCKGCGSCGATCPRSAITMRGYSDAQLRKMVDSLLEVST